MAYTNHLTINEKLENENYASKGFGVRFKLPET